MTTASALFARWTHWWTRTGPPHVIALFRIAFGGFLFFYYAIQLPYVAMLYSREGILLPLIEPTTVIGLPFVPPPAWVAYVLFLSFLSFLLCFTLGAWTRGTAVLSFILYVYYWILSLHQFGTSFDRLFLFSLLVLCCSGCGKTFSVDMRVRAGSFLAWEPVSILPQRLLAVQIAATYLGVGWQKIILDDWQSGEVLAWGFVGRWATPPAWWIARLNIPIRAYDVAVDAIKWFEVTIPFGLWFRRTRWWYMAGGTLFHVGIAILLDIWWFLALIPAYVVFFRPEDVRAFLGRRVNFIPLQSSPLPER
jgi:hypothetical protein